jgi:hypothetical protein
MKSMAKAPTPARMGRPVCMGAAALPAGGEALATAEEAAARMEEAAEAMAPLADELVIVRKGQ